MTIDSSCYRWALDDSCELQDAALPSSIGRRVGSSSYDSHLQQPERHRRQQQLVIAIYYGDFEKVVELCKAGVEMWAAGLGGPLHGAAANGQVRIAQCLLKHGVVVDSTALLTAVNAGHIDMVRALIRPENPFDEDVRPTNQSLPESYCWHAMLQEAIERDHEEIFLLLVLRKLDSISKVQVDLPEQWQKVLLDGYLVHAAGHRAMRTCQHLLDLGADVNGTDPEGKTPLLAAAAKNYDTTIDFLLQHGATVTSNVLELAVQENCHEVVKLLILRYHTRSSGLKSVTSNILEHAVQNNCHEVVKLLILKHNIQSSGLRSNSRLLDYAMFSADQQYASKLVELGVPFSHSLLEDAFYSREGQDVAKDLLQHQDKLLAHLHDCDAVGDDSLTSTDSKGPIRGQLHRNMATSIKTYGILVNEEYVNGARTDLVFTAGLNLSQCRKWLHECMTRHGICRLTERSLPELPRRVVYTGSSDSVMKPHLVEGPETRGYYCTLSYRWQPGEQLMTTHATLEQHKLDIDMDQAPRAIKTALQVCRDLSIKYLWVDALCIVQDSNDDKMQEMANMAQIYNNSLFNIAIVETQDQEELTSSGRIRPRGSIDDRAWIVQEQILSRRQLVITKDKVYWDCITQCATEEHPSGCPVEYDPSFYYRDQRILKEVINLGFIATSKAPLRSTLHRSWYRIVEDYSRRRLTSQADRAIAIDGVVKRIARVIHDDCLAGLWRGTFLQDLCWYTDLPASPSDGNDDAARREMSSDDTTLEDHNSTETTGTGMFSTHQQQVMSTFSAPSWSWLASEGPVKYVGLSDERSFYTGVGFISATVSLGESSIYNYNIAGRAILRGVSRKCEDLARDARNHMRVQQKLKPEEIDTVIKRSWKLDNGDDKPHETARAFICSTMPVWLVIEPCAKSPGSGTDVQWRRVGIATFLPRYKYINGEKLKVELV